MSPYKSDILDVRLMLLQQTDRAIRVSDGALGKSVWLPLSQIEMSPAPTVDGVRYVDVQIRQWLAEEKGLA